jgi:hypothetical protein
MRSTSPRPSPLEWAVSYFEFPGGASSALQAEVTRWPNLQWPLRPAGLVQEAVKPTVASPSEPTIFTRGAFGVVHIRVAAIRLNLLLRLSMGLCHLAPPGVDRSVPLIYTHRVRFTNRMG